MAMGICRDSVQILGQVAVEKKLRCQSSSSVRVGGHSKFCVLQLVIMSKVDDGKRASKRGDKTALCIVI